MFTAGGLCETSMRLNKKEGNSRRQTTNGRKHSHEKSRQSRPGESALKKQAEPNSFSFSWETDNEVSTSLCHPHCLLCKKTREKADTPEQVTCRSRVQSWKELHVAAPQETVMRPPFISVSCGHFVWELQTAGEGVSLSNGPFSSTSGFIFNEFGPLFFSSVCRAASAVKLNS
ncbi:hypothetical protein TGPRC2_219090 [Toxoplasma gondii TgCatPRC2]|uniref:Uncharacterized protein n=2 Tax=Toxoplasma gondii TaxID=5811 RepID=A0A151HCU1_TOXGO|nr:hypothetical protein TGARI_219090 [Toxoplasma gondii ARI]KYK67161.1 hypothetical protein TGPRC2_219090 [Toxoplasma gondii TgCatPRC2]